jgi:hypothetical protein
MLKAGKLGGQKAWKLASIRAFKPSGYVLFACLPAVALKAKGGHLNL